MEALEEKQDSRYVWVCGTSGVGKETFIRRVKEESCLSVKKILGLREPIFAFGPGFESYSVESLAQLEGQNAVIKWQFRTHQEIAKLIKLKPESCHNAVLLWRPYDKQINDLKGRSVWAERDTPETLEFDWKIIKRLFSRLQGETGLKYFIINASENNYEVINSWPE